MVFVNVRLAGVLVRVGAPSAPSDRKGSHLIILNRIEKYAAVLAKQCDDRASTDIDLGGLLPWEEA